MINVEQIICGCTIPTAVGYAICSGHLVFYEQCVQHNQKVNCSIHSLPLQTSEGTWQKKIKTTYAIQYVDQDSQLQMTCIINFYINFKKWEIHLCI